MLINVSFDKECDRLEDADIIDVPKRIIDDIENIQKSFFAWMFDKKNDHQYWIYDAEEKKYCSYGTDAFVDWLNEHILKDTQAKAMVVKRNAQEIDLVLPTIYF